MKFPIKDFFGKCDQIRSFLRIWSHLLNKSLIENLIFCAVSCILQATGVKVSVSPVKKYYKMCKREYITGVDH